MRIFVIPLSITFLNLKILGLLFPTKNSLTWGMKCENRRKFLGKASKIIGEWNGQARNF